MADPTSLDSTCHFHPKIVLDGQPTRVMCEMVGAVDVTHLGDRVAHLDIGELASIDDALGLVLDLG